MAKGSESKAHPARGGPPPGAGEWEEILRAAEAACREAMPLARRAFAAGPAFEIKPDGSPVTPHDREVEALLRARLEAARPDFGWLGEETGSARPDSRLVWVVDPIDGTKHFIAGLPVYGIFVGAALDGEPAAGAMALPEQNRVFSAAPGLGLRVDGRPAGRASPPPPGRGVAVVSNPAALEARSPGACASR